MSTYQLPFNGDFRGSTIEDIVNRQERLYYLYLGLKAEQRDLHEDTRRAIRKDIESMVEDFIKEFRRPVERGYRY